MVADAKKTPYFLMLKSWAVKDIMLLTITHLIIYILLLNNEEAGNV